MKRFIIGLLLFTPILFSALRASEGTSASVDTNAQVAALPKSLSPSPSPSPIPAATVSGVTSPVVPVSLAKTSATPAPLVTREIPGIHSTMLLPADWTFLPGKLLEGDVLVASREKITSESDPWTVGLTMTMDRNGAKDSGQKASDYALALAREANQKAGEEATPIKESQSGSMHEARFDFSVAGDQPLVMTEVLRANDATGTLTVILWQSPKEESAKLRDLKETILAGIKLDPTQ